MKGKSYLMVLLCCSLFLFAGCGSGGTETGTTGTIADTVFYDDIDQVAPVFAAAGGTSLSSKSVNAEWAAGNPLYALFNILREFDPETDQGVVDTSNLYKTMWEGRNFLGNTRTACSTITEQVIAPPFDFGNPETTYNCAHNTEADDGYDIGGAIKDLDADGNIIVSSDEGEEEEEGEESEIEAAAKYGIFGFVWPGDHNEYGVLQGSFDSATDALLVDIAVWVDYADQADYCYRNDIDGDTETHLFTFRSIVGTIEPESINSIVGKGVSQGEGEHFLLKIASTGNEAKYYCIGADDGETELMAMDAEGSDTVDPNCADYQADVDALTMFTADDLACQTSDFNPGGTGTAAEGTIFLNFE